MAKTAEEFWARVEKTDGCWLWRGSISGGTGYGNLSFDGRMQSSHRVAWKITYGEIPEGAWICHHCDVRNCVRPDHLFLGTPKDNYDDMVAKGRRVLVSHNRGKTYCIHGHEFTPENTYHYGEHRYCRRCKCDREMAAAKKPRPIVSHGSSGYNRGCRCDMCRAAGRARHLRNRKS